jgi:hypothetical protein
MQTNEYELVVVPGNRPIWKTILAAVFFTAIIFLVFQFVQICSRDILEKPNEMANILKCIGFCIAGGIYFSLMKIVLIDTDKDKLISRFFIGPFSKDVITSVPQLEYVAVFKNQKDIYEVNLWYKGNKHYMMYAFDEKKAAFKFAEMVIEKLSLDLLDATERGNSKWIEKIQSPNQNAPIT